MKYILFTLSFLLSGYSLLQAQRTAPQMRFGKVSVADMAYQGDAAAAELGAVILNDYGSLSFDLINRKAQVVQVFHRRLKILNEKGMAYTRIELPYTATEYIITDIKAATYKAGPDGTPVAFKLDKRKIKDIRNRNGLSYKVIELPLVEPGVVVEYSYARRVKDFTWAIDWQFQQELPVRYSEFHSFIPSSFGYQVIPRGTNGKMFQFQEPYQESSFNNVISSPLNRGVGANNLNVMNRIFNGRHEWFVMENLAPVEKDPFTPEGNNYLPGLRILFSRDLISGRRNTDLFEGWEELNQYWYKRTRSKKLKLERTQIERILRKELVRSETPRQQLEKIYALVRDRWDWDETYSLRLGRLDKDWDSKQLGGTELNMIMCQIARVAGFDAYPVMIRTKDKGMVEMMYPAQNQFNHAIVAVELEGEDVLMDATYQLPGFGVLPEQSLNQIGYLVNDMGGRWVKLQAANRVVRVTYSRFSLNPEGLLTGAISVRNQDFGAAMERERVQRYAGDLEPYIRKYVLTGIDTAAILNNAIADHVDGEQELIVNCDVQTRAFVQQAGEFMFVKPMMTKIVAQNPFPAKDRSTPIDLSYPLRESHMLGIRIPDDYMVEQVPEPIRVSLPNKAGSFTYNVLEYDNILHFTSTIYLNKTLFMPEEYQAIRAFFEYIVRKHDEDLILKRKG